MTNRELAVALRLCGSEKPIDNCPKCPFFDGYDPNVCIPKMTAACADALENSETHVAALQKEIEKLRGQLKRQWISVEERLPDVGKDVLTLGTAGAVRMMRLNKGGHDGRIVLPEAG